MKRENCVCGVNGGYFDTEFKPIGLRVADNRTFSPLRRARLITASFLVRRLGIDWRAGARHFFEWLVDGDVANNTGNWQWVAGTGANPRPGRVLNPLRQARRFDPHGSYVRRYVRELAAIEGGAVHEPWQLGKDLNGYPTPIIDLA